MATSKQLRGERKPTSFYKSKIAALAQGYVPLRIATIAMGYKAGSTSVATPQLRYAQALGFVRRKVLIPSELHGVSFWYLQDINFLVEQGQIGPARERYKRRAAYIENGGTPLSLEIPVFNPGDYWPPKESLLPPTKEEPLFIAEREPEQIELDLSFQEEAPVEPSEFDYPTIADLSRGLDSLQLGVSESINQWGTRLETALLKDRASQKESLQVLRARLDQLAHNVQVLLLDLYGKDRYQEFDAAAVDTVPQDIITGSHQKRGRGR